MVNPLIYYASNPEELISQFLPNCAEYSAIFLLTEKNVETHCYPLVSALLPPHKMIVIKEGESFKTLESCVQIWDTLSANAADRRAVLLNLGGGMITDIGGFAAGCYKRGIDFFHFPTSLLAMVDAAIGGKTGIDFKNFKNQIGSFREPKAIFCCIDFLKTLPARQLHSGMAEVMKHYLIGDARKWREFQKTDPKGLEAFSITALRAAVEVKNEVVNRDPLEQGPRKILNFGHTIGHAIESAFLDSKRDLLHGEAVALGIMGEAFLSYKRKRITAQELDEIVETVLKWFSFQQTFLEMEPRLLEFIKQDKKNTYNRLQFALLNGIGNCDWDVEVTFDEVREALLFVNEKIRQHAAVSSR